MQIAPGQLLAQDDQQLLEDTVNAPEMDVDGDFKRETESDRLAKLRKKHEMATQEMMEKKLEDRRLDNERKLNEEMRQALQGQSTPSDEVSTRDSSVAKVESSVEEDDRTWNQADFKVIPMFGVQNISNSQLDLESEVSTAIAMEAVVTKHVTVGLSLGYMNMDMTDMNANNGGFGGGFNSSFGGFNSFYNTYGLNYGFNNPQNMYNNFYGQNYANAFGSQGREMSYKRFTAEINSKFFLFPEKRLRPYVGLGIGYNRGQLSYTDQGNNFQWNGLQLGNEEYRSSYISGSAMLGAEVSFTKNIGMSLDFRYARGLTSGTQVQTGNTFAFNPDQIALENLGRDIEEADSFGLNLGVVISF
jgi:hypothetical protein